MRLLINTHCLSDTKTGIGHYTQNLVGSLRKQARFDTIDTFPGFWFRVARRGWTRARSWLSSEISSATGDNYTKIQYTYFQRLFRLICKSHRYDLYHEPNYIPLSDEIPVVTTLHDLSVLLHPQWHPANRIRYFERMIHKCLSGCVHFLSVSRFGRQEVINLLGLRPDQVTNIYQGIRPEMVPLPEYQVKETLRRLGLPIRYLLYVGTIEPRKNVATLLRAYVQLPASVRDKYPLILVGSWGWNSDDVRTLLSAYRHMNVHYIGYVSDKYLPILYNGARALLFPSFYEGFGLPPVEMLACGGAVLGSTASALVETIGNQAHLVDPLDLDEWRQGMLRVTTDDEWWFKLRCGAQEIARSFTWKVCADQTLNVYRRLCKNK